jgi:hypothetical protein
MTMTTAVAGDMETSGLDRAPVWRRTSRFTSMTSWQRPSTRMQQNA